MFIFGVSMFFNLGLTMLWLYLELCGLCLIPLFFWGGAGASLSSLFYYIVFSGISSSLLLVGILLPESLFFVISGLLVKFGVFPFWGWVYRVCCYSNWLVIWGFSTVLKVSFVFFPLFLVLGASACNGVLLLSSLGCLVLSFFFWYFAHGWKVLWCHMMLSSSSVLVGLGASGCGVPALVSIYLVYFFWASLVLLYLWFAGDSCSGFEGRYSVFLFGFLILSLPVSLSIYYKIVVCSCIFSTSLILLLCWCIYSISEQLYLFLALTGLYSGKFSGGLLS